MTLFHRAAFTLFLTLSLAAPAFAAPYFDTNSIAPMMIDTPPAPHSAQWKDEVEQILALQKNASEQDLAQAKDERNMRPEMVAELPRESHPALYKLLDRVSETSYPITGQAKDFWNTRRPYLMDTRIKALIEAHNNPAYPSGHTTGSYVWAYVMGMVMPEKKDQFRARAEAIAQHRVLVGMHYPHDVRGGKQLALLIVGGLLQSAEFQKDLELAKQESTTKH